MCSACAAQQTCTHTPPYLCLCDFGDSC
uniref:Uncharacterized protein n=1 Tax=Anguilla anguilla TaxID=7936 RepID=A0A0E9W521_ANGAN